MRNWSHPFDHCQWRVWWLNNMYVIAHLCLNARETQQNNNSSAWALLHRCHLCVMKLPTQFGNRAGAPGCETYTASLLPPTDNLFIEVMNGNEQGYNFSELSPLTNSLMRLVCRYTGFKQNSALIGRGSMVGAKRCGIEMPKNFLEVQTFRVWPSQPGGDADHRS